MKHDTRLFAQSGLMKHAWRLYRYRQLVKRHVPTRSSFGAACANPRYGSEIPFGCFDFQRGVMPSQFDAARASRRLPIL